MWQKVALKQESLGENVEILGPNPNWNDKFIEFCPYIRRKNINLMKLGAKLKLELILRNDENLHTMFIMYSFNNLKIIIIGFWKNAWWSIYNWFDVCGFEVFRCCVWIMNNLNVFKINTLFSWFFFLCESILWLIYNLIVFSVHLLLIRRFFSCGHFFLKK